MSTQLTIIKDICLNIERMGPQFKAALPPGLPVDRFMRTAIHGIQSHRDRDKLGNADRRTLYLAIQKAASDGLVLDGREAALSVFHNKDKGSDEVVYMPMVQGLVKLARNSGEIAKIASEVVYSKDKFTYRPGVDEAPVHEPDWFADDRGEPVGVWATVTLKTGEIIAAVLPKKKVLNVAAKSRNGYQYDPAKGSFFDEWWKKTAIRNVLKYAPKSNELQEALKADDKLFEGPVIDHETGEVLQEGNANPETSANDGGKLGKKETRAARAVKAKATKQSPEVDAEAETIETEYREIESKPEDTTRLSEQEVPI